MFESFWTLLGYKKETEIVKQQETFNAKGLKAKIDIEPPMPEVPQVQARWVDDLNLSPQQKEKLFTAKNAFLLYLKDKTDDIAFLGSIASKWIVSDDIKAAFDKLKTKTNFDKIAPLDADKITAFKNLNQSFAERLGAMSAPNINTILTKMATVPQLASIIKDMSEEQCVKFAALDANQVAAFANVTDDTAKTYLTSIKDISVAKELLNQLHSKPSLNAVFEQTHNTVGKYQTLSEQQLHTLINIQDINIRATGLAIETQEAGDFADKILASPNILKLVAKLKTTSNLVKLLTLSDQQISTYIAITNTNQLAEMEKMPTEDIKTILDNLKTEPKLQNAINKLATQADLQKIVKFSSSELKIFLSTSDTNIAELGGLPLPKLKEFCSLSKEELKNYFDATSGRANLKAEVKKLDAAKIKLFCTDFTTANNPDIANTLTYLGQNPQFLTHWALLGNATPQQRSDKNLYLSLTTVVSSDVKGHAQGDTAPVGGGHFSSGFEYVYADAKIYNLENKLRFLPAYVTAPVNYATTNISPLLAKNPKPAKSAVPAVTKVSNIEIKDGSNTWHTKGNPSTMFPTNWTLAQIEAETALAYMKISDSPSTTHNNGNCYVVNDSSGAVSLRVCIGNLPPIDAHPFTPDAKRDTPIKTAFPN